MSEERPRSWAKSLAAGALGAAAVTLFAERLQHVTRKAPRLDRLGMEATREGLHALGLRTPRGKSLYRTSLAGDLLSNGLFYAWASSGGYLRAGAAGLLAGVGAVVVPGAVGLSSKHTRSSREASGWTIAAYMLGSLVARAAAGVLA